jgi:hypothetical protein
MKNSQQPAQRSNSVFKPPLNIWLVLCRSGVRGTISEVEALMALLEAPASGGRTSPRRCARLERHRATKSRDAGECHVLSAIA